MDLSFSILQDSLAITSLSSLKKDSLVESQVIDSE